MEKTTGGFGTGLPLVEKRIVEAEIDGECGGSEFLGRLPALVSVGSPLPPVEKIEEVAPSGGRRILVVDDNVDAADSLGLLLEILGNEVRLAYDGEAGVESAGAFRPAVVLCDIRMPKLNGYDAARRVRSEPWGRDMVLVALTGWGQETDRQKCTEAGFNQHLLKPVEAAALMNLLAGLNQA